MLFIVYAVTVLLVIVYTTLSIENLKKKVAIYLGLGAVTVSSLLASGHEGREVMHHVFLADYPQFIPIPLATVMIASLSLFSVRILPGTKLGWFLFLALPLIGNFATTWALVPIMISLYPIMRLAYPQRWLLVMITAFIFPGNMLAMATLLADPPQAYWAIKQALLGKPMGFFFPLTVFWPYLLVTWVLYYIALRRLGVEFGSLKNLAGIRPLSWVKTACGIGIALAIAFSLMYLQGYQITMALGAACLLAATASFFLGHEERHNTLHWNVETAAIFIAFFSVVALAHMGLQHVNVSNVGAVGVVIGMTLTADNAAAFAAAYPHYAPQGAEVMSWYNLFNAIAYGGLSPIGNGPQITAFLVILVAMKAVTAAQVFKTWLVEASVFGPYLLMWTFLMPVAVAFRRATNLDFDLMILLQLAIGIAATTVCLQCMDLHRVFRRFADSPEQPTRTELHKHHHLPVLTASGAD